MKEGAGGCRKGAWADSKISEPGTVFKGRKPALGWIPASFTVSGCALSPRPSRPTESGGSSRNCHARASPRHPVLLGPGHLHFECPGDRSAARARPQSTASRESGQTDTVGRRSWSMGQNVGKKRVQTQTEG